MERGRRQIYAVLKWRPLLREMPPVAGIACYLRRVIDQTTGRSHIRTKMSQISADVTWHLFVKLMKIRADRDTCLCHLVPLSTLARFVLNRLPEQEVYEWLDDIWSCCGQSDAGVLRA